MLLTLQFHVSEGASKQTYECMFVKMRFPDSTMKLIKSNLTLTLSALILTCGRHEFLKAVSKCITHGLLDLVSVLKPQGKRTALMTEKSCHECHREQ